MKILRSRLTSYLLSALLLLPPLAQTCGPYFPEVVPVRTRHPDGPWDHFVSGQIGVVLPTWWRAYLVVAYRYFGASPLSTSERQSLTARNPETNLPLWNQTEPVIAGDPGDWLTVRNSLANTSLNAEIEPFKSLADYQGFINCTNSAFAVAVETLQQRVGTFGRGSSELQEWIAGQDKVFQNCAGGVVIPDALPATANELLRKDREYQIAAAHFYSGSWQDARRRFEAIAGDPRSPWRRLGKYLAARTLVRQATLDIEDRDGRTPLFTRALELLQESDADPATTSQEHTRNKRYRDLINLRMPAGPYQREVALKLASGAAGDQFAQNLSGYTYLLDQVVPAEPDFPGVAQWVPDYREQRQAWTEEAYVNLRQARADDLTDWVLTVQSDAAAASAHALEKWRSSKNIPWLAAALLRARADTPGLDELMRAGNSVQQSSAAYPTIVYHLARLARETGRFADSRRLLDDPALQAIPRPPSTKNLLASEQMLVAGSAEEFAASLARQPADFVACAQYDCFGLFGQPEPPEPATAPLPQFDALGALLVNWGIPSEVLLQILDTEKLPTNLQKRLARALWTRAALLNDGEITKRAGEELRRLEPRLTAYLAGYENSSTTEERSYAVAYMMLHFPGLRPFVEGPFPRGPDLPDIDNYRDNWWCADMGSLVESPSHNKDWGMSDGSLRVNGKLSLPDLPFVSTQQKQSALAERERLLAIGEAVRYLPRFVIDWATKHRNDPRSPEGLYYAIRAMRYGCGAQDYSHPNPMAREAFGLLHRNYGGSTWAKRTPYYFD